MPIEAPNPHLDAHVSAHRDIIELIRALDPRETPFVRGIKAKPLYHCPLVVEEVMKKHQEVLSAPMQGDYMVRFHVSRQSTMSLDVVEEGDGFRIFYEVGEVSPRAVEVDRLHGEDREKILHILCFNGPKEYLDKQREHAFIGQRGMGYGYVYNNYIDYNEGSVTEIPDTPAWRANSIGTLPSTQFRTLPSAEPTTYTIRWGQRYDPPLFSRRPATGTRGG